MRPPAGLVGSVQDAVLPELKKLIDRLAASLCGTACILFAFEGVREPTLR